MRSTAATFLMSLATAALCALAGWQWKSGGFEAMFGAPPVPLGGKLYGSLKPEEVRHIHVSGNGANAAFSLGDNGWQASSPWQDRMDPRAATGIIGFTMGMRVEDIADIDDTDSAKSGLGDSAVRIRLEDGDRKTLATYRLGRTAPWKAEIEGREEPEPTVFVQARERSRRGHVYICTGDINPLFKDGLKFLRDHRPFYFNPVTLQKIRIRSQQGDLTLGRETPQGAWRIVKPLDLPTDPVAMKSLLEGIFELQATRVADRGAVTLPAADNPVKTNQIALVPFGSETETVLETYPPETPEAREVKATVSDRLNTVFDLPLKPEPNLVTLANLPLTVNELRDATLTHLNIQSLRAISIQPTTGREIVISRESGQPWMATIDEVTQQANEENLYSLLKAVTTTRAIGFESDAATDFTPWGLDRPVLVLRFLAFDNQALELRFGIDSKGGAFVNRLGTPTVMRVDRSLLAEIAVRPFEWRHSNLWSLSRIYLLGIEWTLGSEPTVELTYEDNLERWQARRGGQDVSGSLDTAQANYLLGILEELKANRWLATDDAGALEAFATPSLRINLLEEIRDDDFNVTGLRRRSLVCAPSPGANPGFYYGRLDSEKHPFLIDRDTYRKLATKLLD